MLDYNLNQQQVSSRTAAREAFFLDFAQEARKRHPNVVLMLTGGFRSRQGAEAAVKENACDLVGIGRPACINPKLPLLFLDDSVKDEEAQLPLKKAPVPVWMKWLPVRVQSAGAETVSIPYILSIHSAYLFMVQCRTFWLF
jgi:tRNA-dihydrouridine synthase